MPATRLMAAAALMAAVGLAIPSDSVRAQEKTFELKLAHFAPPNHAFHKWATEWAARLEQESKGRLKLTLYPNGQLVGPPNRQFDAVRNGVSDIGFTLHGVTPGRYAMTELANLPFTWPSSGQLPENSAPRMTELGPEFLHQEHQGLKVLFMTAAAPVVLFSRKPVRSVEDFKGLRVRYSGVQNRASLDALGAVPMLVPPPESQDALARGIVDAALFPYEAGVAYDLGTVADYAIEPPMASVTFAMVMNPAKYKSLPSDLQKLIDDTTGQAAAESFGKVWSDAERAGRDRLVKNGLEIIKLSDEEAGKMRVTVKPVIESAIGALEKKGRPARKFYEAYTK